MQFCPHDGTLLVVQTVGALSFCCSTCPYINKLTGDTSVRVRTRLTNKKEGDVLGGEESWKNAPQTDVQKGCDECGSHRAYYVQFQTRSADEPMTVFYKCCTCGFQWKE